MGITRLPKFDECAALLEKDLKLTPLERFVYDNEPTGREEERKFREGLSALIRYVEGCC